VPAVALLAVAASFTKSQSLELNESRTWDTSTMLMVDGSSPEHELGDVFRTGRGRAVPAYSQLLYASGNNQEAGPVMAGFDTGPRAGSVTLTSPLVIELI
jgi:hypothetical protein